MKMPIRLLAMLPCLSQPGAHQCLRGSHLSIERR